MLGSLWQWGREALRYRRLCNHQVAGLDRIRDRLTELRAIGGDELLPAGADLSQLAVWLDDLDRTVGRSHPARPRRLLFFSVMPFWVAYCLPVAVVLAGRDCLIDFVWLPYYLFDREEPTDPAAVRPPAHLTRWLPHVRLHSRLRLTNLLHVQPAPVTEELVALARETSRLDPRYIEKRELFDIETDPHARHLFNFRVRRNLDCLRRLETILRTNRYDTVLTPHGGVYEFGAAYELSRARGLPCVTFDTSDRKSCIYGSNTVPCVSFDFDDVWEADAPHVLTPEREAVAMRHLLLREGPNATDEVYVWHGQSVTTQPEQQLRTELGLQPGRPIALLCTNIAWDAVTMRCERAFPTMAQWVLNTVKWFRDRPDWYLLVRCHPGEVAFPSNEPVDELIAQHFPTLPEHVRVIKPGDPVNTYSLMRMSNFGLVFASTTGMEMATRGIPVVVCGKIHYARRGFTTDPATAAEYFATLERMTANKDLTRLSREEVALARCYAYLYFEKVPRPFPWRDICRPWDELERWPVRHVLQGRCPPEFLETFDFLAGRPAAATARGASAA